MALTDLLAPSRISEQAVATSIREAATRGERYVSIGRIVSFSIILARQAWVFTAEDRVWDGGLQLLVSSWVLVALAYSGFVGWTYRARPAPDWVFGLSIVVDVGCCFIALLGNSLWPSSHYDGNLMLPDIAFLIIPIVVSCIRLYPILVVEATLLSTLGFAYLVYFDLDRFPLPQLEIFERTTTVAAMLAGSAIGAFMTSFAIQRLALDAAERTLQAKGMEHRLGVLMRDHHDARTLLSSAALNAELVHEQISRNATGSQSELARIAADLRHDLRAVNEYVASIRDRAFQGVHSSIESADVDLISSIRSVVGQLQSYFPETRIVVTVSEPSLHVSIPGDPASLDHAIQNLVANACEGDGGRRARRVEVSARPDGDRQMAVIEVRDDGPGFSSAILDSTPGQRTTSKADGSGLGLWLVESWLYEIGSPLRIANGPEGGAVVRFELPMAGTARSSTATPRRRS